MLITPNYLKEQQRLHRDDSVYGTIGHKWAYLVAGIGLVEGCDTILDYGCGKGTLAKAIHSYVPRNWVFEYDPAIAGKDLPPYPADLVVCTDVLEHIEPECLQNGFLNLADLTRKLLFVVISTKFDKGRTLSDGRNSHLIVNEGPWWEEKFSEYGFKVKRTWNTGVKEWVTLMERV